MPSSDPREKSAGSVKEKFSVTTSPYAKKRVKEFVDKGDFSSESEFILCAVLYFLGRLDLKEEYQKTGKMDMELNDIKRRIEEDTKKQ